jgi:hypothetical protein
MEQSEYIKHVEEVMRRRSARKFCVVVAKLDLSPREGFCKGDVIGKIKKFADRFGRD